MKATISFAILMAFSNIIIGKNINSDKTVDLHSEEITGSNYSNNSSDEAADLEVAISDCKKALKLAKKEKDVGAMADLYGKLGASHYGLNDYVSANKYLLKGYKLNPNHPVVLYNLVLVSFKLSKSEDVLAYIDNLVNIDPEFIKLYNHIGRDFARQGNHDKAITFFNIALEKDPKNNIAFSNRSNSRLALGDVIGAMVDIQRSIREDGTSSWAYKVRGLISVEKEDMRRACFDFRLANELETEKLHGPAATQLIEVHCSSK